MLSRKMDYGLFCFRSICIGQGARVVCNEYYLVRFRSPFEKLDCTYSSVISTTLEPTKYCNPDVLGLVRLLFHNTRANRFGNHNLDLIKFSFTW